VDDCVVEATPTTAADSFVLHFLRVDFVVVGTTSSGRYISIFVYTEDDDDGVAPSFA
jgi:hypothetical protein